MPGKHVSDIEAQIAALEKRIADEPRRILEAENRRRNTIPASDELREQLRDKTYEANLTRNQVRNIRVSQSKDGTLLILFVFAMIAIAGWIFRTLETL